MTQPKIFSMQLTVPHSKFGKCSFFMPEIIRAWICENLGPFDYTHCGENRSGDGYTNGVTNTESVYIIKWLLEEDGTRLKIAFPECRVHMSCQYD